MEITWIASYPRSGNTWVRLLLHHYYFGDIDNTDLIGARIPDLHYLLNTGKILNHNNSPIMVKSHFCCSATHPYRNRTSSFIYVMRNPRDVLLSNARVLCKNISTEKLREFADMFIQYSGVKHWHDSGMGTWTQHVASWIGASNVPSHFVKYEDLRADSEQGLKDILRFLGESPDEKRVRAAVKDCSLPAVSDLEKREMKKGRSNFFSKTGSGKSFIGSGEVSESLDWIHPEIEQKFQLRFRSLLKLFKYS